MGCWWCGEGELQGRWWPTWKRAARDAPGQMTSLAGFCRCHRHVPSWDLLQGDYNPIRARRERCCGDAERGLGDRTTPAADYGAQWSEERHMPLKLLRRARRCFHLQAPNTPPPNRNLLMHTLCWWMQKMNSEGAFAAVLCFHVDCILLVSPSRATGEQGRCTWRQQ